MTSTDDDNGGSRRFTRGVLIAAGLALVAGTFFVYLGLRSHLPPTLGGSAAPPPSGVVSDIPAYHLSREGTLLDPKGAAVTAAVQIAGQVDRVDTQANKAFISGWAFDPAADAPVSLVIGFVNGTLSGAIRPAKSRPDVAAALNNRRAEPSGFVLPVDVPPDAAANQLLVQVFVLTQDGSGRELGYPAGYPFKRR